MAAAVALFASDLLRPDPVTLPAIVGGESGPDARPMREAWALSVRDRCRAAGAAFHFKQWGAWGPDGVLRDKRANGRRAAGGGAVVGGTAGIERGAAVDG